MKVARLVVLGVAVVAGGLAAVLAGRESKPPPAPVVENGPKLDTADVLVASNDIGLGNVVAAGDMSWQAWPASTANGTFIVKKDRPDAIETLAGSIARAPFVAGEPMRESKLVKAKGSGFMAAILPSGMRAVSTEISPETGAGGFILPNDRVDVILSHRERNPVTSEVRASETILTNVRVLAIDQTVEEKNGQKVVVGKTATLELTPNQAETLAMARQLGTLALALRSITDADSKPSVDDNATRSSINVVRYGVTVPTTTK
ncbi:MAG TPA: Flp pilus assembly protein CpaB [Pseudolabrys sp.]|nr:Flp pilus assembly protein CpaB [Pseudolabrys sp.]